MPGFLLCVNGRAGFMQPGIAFAVIEMPVRVDQMFDRIAADARQRCRQRGACGAKARLYEELAIGSGEDGDVAARAQDHVQIVAHTLNRQFRRGGVVAHGGNDSFLLSEGLVTSQHRRRSGEARCGEEVTPGEVWSGLMNHNEVAVDKR